MIKYKQLCILSSCGVTETRIYYFYHKLRTVLNYFAKSRTLQQSNAFKTSVENSILHNSSKPLYSVIVNSRDKFTVLHCACANAHSKKLASVRIVFITAYFETN